MQHFETKINPMLFLPWVFTFVSSSRITELRLEMLPSVSCDHVHWCFSPTPTGCCFIHTGFGIWKVWQYKQRRRKKKKRERKKYFAVISAQTWGKGVEEVRRLQIAQYYTFPYLLYFLTAVQLSHVPKCCRSHMWNEKKCLLTWVLMPFITVGPFISRLICNEARTISFACWKRYCCLHKPPSLWSTGERIQLAAVASRLLVQSLSKNQLH